jgi:hypothetical protein
LDVFVFEDGDLLSESEDFQGKVSAGPKKDSGGGKQSDDVVDHETTVVTPFSTGIRNLTIRPQVIDLAQRFSSGNTQPSSVDTFLPLPIAETGEDQGKPGKASEYRERR